MVQSYGEIFYGREALVTKVIYGSVKQIYRFDGRERTVYGIAVCSEDGEVLDEVCGICKDEKTVDELVELCNTLELSPMHIRDVAEDFIYTQKIKLCQG